MKKYIVIWSGKFSWKPQLLCRAKVAHVTIIIF